MKALKNLVLFSILSLAASCTGSSGKVLCDAGKVTAGVVAVGIGTELACTNVEAIKLTLQEKILGTSVCDSKDKSLNRSAVGSIVCAPLIESVFAGGLAQIPKEWGCTGGASITELKAKLIESCVKSI